MMKAKPAIFLYPIFLFTLPLVFGQDHQNESTLKKQYLLERLSLINPTTGLIPGIPLSRPTIIGSSFLKENFSLTSFHLTNGHVTKQLYAKFDVLRNEFYVINGNAYNVLSGNEVNYFNWQDSINYTKESYINSNQLNFEKGLDIIGFFKILSQGDICLFKHSKANMLDPNYNVALSLGRQDYKITMTESLYYYKNEIVFKLPSSRKFLSIFEDNQKKWVMEFIDLNNLDLQNERHLVEIFNYYNSKIGTSSTKQ